ncbi:MAG: IMP dehydrogenase [Bacteriovoracales bacterium]|nr:IMP dehydrogenase [Bacteriovoracales bacterium]
MDLPKDFSLTFDDVLLAPGYSELSPSRVELGSRFSRTIPLNIPVISSAMDTVTESGTAIVMAQEGGLGVIHKNLSGEDQALEVEKVKKYEAGMIMAPITVHPDDGLEKVAALTEKYNISGVPVVDSEGRFVGILTNRDLRFETNFDQRVGEVMTKENLITAPEGTTLEEAKSILQRHRIEKLPVVDERFGLKGLITIKDIEKSIAHPHSNKDSLGRLRVAAAVGVGEGELERAKLLVERDVDALVIDTAHAHSKAVVEMLRRLKSSWGRMDVVVGNVATEKACRDLIREGADALKVGIGPGSICTTRVVTGVGMPQIQALLNCRNICEREGIPFTADGGIKYSGDIVKALACGAGSVMIGSLFAGTDESPGEMVLYQGRSYKVYRGMGSLAAMNLGSKDRYGQGEVSDHRKFVPEGIEGQVPYRGALSSVIYQLMGGLRSGMSYVGARNMGELWEKARFLRISQASLKESHPHDVLVTKEAPNYRLS